MNFFAPQPPEPPWYASGLAFECRQCGRCCSGPEEGFVWVNDVEITRIAAFVNLSAQVLRDRFLRRVSGRYTVIEQPRTRDCAFLVPDAGGAKRCAIYPVRPAQCRTWPFWRHNLDAAGSWLRAGQRCPGINRGRSYSRHEIEETLKTTSE